jgi:hypothetical protein
VRLFDFIHCIIITGGSSLLSIYFPKSVFFMVFQQVKTLLLGPPLKSVNDNLNASSTSSTSLNGIHL